MKNKQLTLGFVLMAVLAVGAYAQVEVSVPGANGETVFTYRLNTPDPAMRQVPREITALRQRDTAAFVRLLADYITEKADNDFDRVKKAHDWIALNIKYDTNAFFSGRYPSQSDNEVIKRGSAVCAGYSRAFKTLCDALGIECKTVEGYARGYGEKVFGIENPTISDHDWNIVTIAGKKYLIDTTWDSGYLSGRTFKANYTTEYLFAAPEVFIHEHFPLDPASQLLNPPLDAEAFTKLPFLRPFFFQAAETWPKLAKITEVAAGEDHAFEFILKPEYEFIYGWYTAAGSRVGFSDSYPGKKDVHRVSMPKLRPGSYTLRIWTQISGERKTLYCGEFGFVVKPAEDREP